MALGYFRLFRPCSSVLTLPSIFLVHFVSVVTQLSLSRDSFGIDLITLNIKSLKYLKILFFATMLIKRNKQKMKINDVKVDYFHNILKYCCIGDNFQNILEYCYYVNSN